MDASPESEPPDIPPSDLPVPEAKPSEPVGRVLFWLFLFAPAVCAWTVLMGHFAGLVGNDAVLVTVAATLVFPIYCGFWLATRRKKKPLHTAVAGIALSIGFIVVNFIVWYVGCNLGLDVQDWGWIFKF